MSTLGGSGGPTPRELARLRFAGYARYYAAAAVLSIMSAFIVPTDGYPSIAAALRAGVDDLGLLLALQAAYTVVFNAGLLVVVGGLMLLGIAHEWHMAVRTPRKRPA